MDITDITQKTRYGCHVGMTLDLKAPEVGISNLMSKTKMEPAARFWNAKIQRIDFPRKMEETGGNQGGVYR